MTEPTDDTRSADTESASVDSTADPNRRGPLRLSVIGLAVGVLALGLASIPAIALERAIPNPFADAEEEKEVPRVELPPEREGGITLKYKNLSVNVGGKVAEKEELAEPEPQAEITKDPVRWFTISAIGCALIGLVLAAVGHIRERHTALTVSSMGCCAAAITWQYFVIGIVVGAAAAAFLIVLAILGSALS